MTPEAQRIAIAEACGWTSCETSPPMGRPPKTSGDWMQTPDYLSDLNAMHEAENAVIMNTQFEPIYRHKLQCISEFCSFHASATQRAEALLCTIGQWQDD